jgi:hypothetical protein
LAIGRDCANRVYRRRSDRRADVSRRGSALTSLADSGNMSSDPTPTAEPRASVPPFVSQARMSGDILHGPDAAFGSVRPSDGLLDSSYPFWGLSGLCTPTMSPVSTSMGRPAALQKYREIFQAAILGSPPPNERKPSR